VADCSIWSRWHCGQPASANAAPPAPSCMRCGTPTPHASTDDGATVSEIMPLLGHASLTTSQAQVAVSQIGRTVMFSVEGTSTVEDDRH
jgi:hypothetical protein